MKKNSPSPELPWSWHKSPGWKGQFERVCRWYERIKFTEEPRDLEDFLYSFFQNCFHLREWLLDEKPKLQKKIDDLFKNNVEMRLCQDICNATKHLKLSTPKQPREFSLAREYIGEDMGWFQDSNRLVVLSDGEKYDLLELAGKCLILWQTFLKNNGF